MCVQIMILQARLYCILCAIELKFNITPNTQSKPTINWRAGDLATEWKIFEKHCEFTFKGPLANKTKLVKVNSFTIFIKDEDC